MRFKTKLTIVLILSLLAAPVLPGRADDMAEKGREIFKKFQRAVVTVQVVIKVKSSGPGMGGQANESRMDVTGTIVDGSGLIVLSLAAIDPTEMYESMMDSMGNEESKFKMDAELSDAKILLEDGTELPAEVVLRDKDLDLAFLRPKTKPANPMTSVDLAKSSTAQVLDEVVALNRLGRAAGRSYGASAERINAVVQKPRLFYIPATSMTSTSLGCPAFALDGNILGIFVMRTINTKGGGMTMRDFQPEAYATIILPAADFLKAARQAPEARGEAAKKEELKDSREAKEPK
jgi:S1-C subfamily serine protease